VDAIEQRPWDRGDGDDHRFGRDLCKSLLSCSDAVADKEMD